MRKRARTDSNHAEIMRAFRAIGATVQDLHQVGGGCPDLLVGFRGQNLMVEIKDGEKVESKRKLTADETTWHQNWAGQVDIVESINDAVQLVIGRTFGRAA